MTAQVPDIAALRTSDGRWTVTYHDVNWLATGDSRVHVLDSDQSSHATIDLAEAFEGFSQFAGWSTAGMCWDEERLAYVGEFGGEPCLVIRAWWGARLVVSLREFRPIDATAIADHLHEFECRIVREGLERLVRDAGRPGEPEFERSTESVLCRIDTLVGLPGELVLHDTVPMLLRLEVLLTSGGTVHGTFRYANHRFRRLAQRSLRRLGERPRGYPGLTFLDELSESRTSRIGLLEPQPGPIDGLTKHDRWEGIEHSASIVEVYWKLGAPDDAERVNDVIRLRYDVDADDPYTLVVSLDDQDTVQGITQFFPPFWLGRPEHVGRCGPRLLRLDELPGLRLEVDVLRDLASGGVEPVAGLAATILGGDRDALAPLADALEEAGDPLAADLRGWSAPIGEA